MGSVNSVSEEAKREEDPSTNQGDGEKSKTLIENQGDGLESKTLIEDLKETEEGEEEEEEEECWLCQYIKEGECKDAFIALQKCVDEAEKSGEEGDVTKCKEVRVMFKNCMYENPAYYEPILAGEARAIAKMLMELQVEKEAILAGEAEAIAKALSKLQTEEQPILPAQAEAIAKAFQELEAEKKQAEADGSKGNEAEKKEEEADGSQGKRE